MLAVFKNAYAILEDIVKGKKTTPDKRNDLIVLKIVSNNKTIAFLTTDNGEYTLVYTEDFLTSGIPPFNLRPTEVPEPGKIYRSDILWYAFASRVPSPSRPDFESELANANLKGNEPTLEILGKISKVSISRSWTFQIREAA